MKKNKKIQIETGDVLLLRNKDETVTCMLVLDTHDEGIKILINSCVRMFKTSDLYFERDYVFSLREGCTPRSIEL